MSEAQVKAVLELQKLFAHFNCGKRSYIDPHDFVVALQVEKNVQQDIQEFNKLFLDLIEKVLGESQHPQSQDVIKNLFQGSYSYVTKCSECNYESRRDSTFSELSLQTKGKRQLSECLDGFFLTRDSLSGDNKYMCGGCSKKVDAERFLELKKLPPVLNVQLIRYTYDLETMAKKKLKDPIYIPTSINMGKYIVRSDGQSTDSQGETKNQSEGASADNNMEVEDTPSPKAEPKRRGRKPKSEKKVASQNKKRGRDRPPASSPSSSVSRVEETEGEDVDMEQDVPINFEDDEETDVDPQEKDGGEEKNEVEDVEEEAEAPAPKGRGRPRRTTSVTARKPTKASQRKSQRSSRRGKKDSDEDSSSDFDPAAKSGPTRASSRRGRSPPSSKRNDAPAAKKEAALPSKRTTSVPAAKGRVRAAGLRKKPARPMTAGRTRSSAGVSASSTESRKNLSREALKNKFDEVADSQGSGSIEIVNNGDSDEEYKPEETKKKSAQRKRSSSRQSRPRQSKKMKKEEEENAEAAGEPDVVTDPVPAEWSSIVQAALSMMKDHATGCLHWSTSAPRTQYKCKACNGRSEPIIIPSPRASGGEMALCVHYCDEELPSRSSSPVKRKKQEPASKPKSNSDAAEGPRKPTKRTKSNDEEAVLSSQTTATEVGSMDVEEVMTDTDAAPGSAKKSKKKKSMKEEEPEQLTDDSDDPDDMYDLTALLLHKGNSASAGHYVCAIKDPDTGSWWHFDDETAREFGQKLVINSAAAREAIKASSKSDASGKKTPSSSKKRKGSKSSKKEIDSPSFSEDTSEGNSSDGYVDGVEIDEQRANTSRNAYMLVYKRRSMEHVAGLPPPEEIRRLVEESNAQLQSRIVQYQSFEKMVADILTDRKKAVSKFKQVLQVPEFTSNTFASTNGKSNSTSKNDDDSETDTEDPSEARDATSSKKKGSGRSSTRNKSTPRAKKGKASKKAAEATKARNGDADTNEDVVEAEEGTDEPSSGASTTKDPHDYRILQRPWLSRWCRALVHREAEGDGSSSSSTFDLTSPEGAIDDVDASPNGESANDGDDEEEDEIDAPKAVIETVYKNGPVWPGDLVKSQQSLYCRHGLLAPSNRKDMCRVSTKGWDVVVEECLKRSCRVKGIDVTSEKASSIRASLEAAALDESKLCTQCCFKFQTKLARDNATCSENQSILDGLLIGATSDEDMFWVHSAFISKWKKRITSKKFIENLKETGSRVAFKDVDDVNAAITCEHGKVTVNKKMRQKVARGVWELLKSRYPLTTELPVASSDCEICEVAVAESSVKKRERLDERRAEKKSTKSAQSTKGFPLENRPLLENQTYYILPDGWHRNWVDYLNSSSVDPPGAIDTSTIVCQHSKFPYDIRPLFQDPSSNTPGGYRGTPTGEITAIKEDAYETLKEKHGVTGVPVRITTSPVDGDLGEKSWENLNIEYSPDFCQECADLRMSSHIEEKRDYDDETLEAVIIANQAASQPKGAPLSASGRPSRRSARSGLSTKFHVYQLSSKDTVGTLMMKALESNEFQNGFKVFCNSVELADRSKTLRDYNVLSDSRLDFEVTSAPLHFDELTSHISNGDDKGLYSFSFECHFFLMLFLFVYFCFCMLFLFSFLVVFGKPPWIIS